LLIKFKLDRISRYPNLLTQVVQKAFHSPLHAINKKKPFILFTGLYFFNFFRLLHPHILRNWYSTSWKHITIMY